ncbi:MAG: hypothetical protein D6705_15450 [Deltaproteobacteria bacterium]|nr:MAG: hypothetical protein D6705_15450 [Deltaproteobacteria bacterium]
MRRRVPLDLYVMPLSRYLAGEFDPPPPPPGETRYGRTRPADSPEEARRRVAAMWRHMSDTLGREVRWRDDGDVVFAASTDVRWLHGLRAVAAHGEYPRRIGPLRLGFRLPRDPRHHRGLRRIYDGAPTSYPHLMRHSDNRGFWLPIEFDDPMECGEPQWWKVGSAVRLSRELDAVAREVARPRVGRVRAQIERFLDLFRSAAATAVSARLPIVIEG